MRTKTLCPIGSWKFYLSVKTLYVENLEVASFSSDIQNDRFLSTDFNIAAGTTCQ
jgi:hypothetical protein